MNEQRNISLQGRSLAFRQHIGRAYGERGDYLSLPKVHLSMLVHYLMLTKIKVTMYMK